MSMKWSHATNSLEKVVNAVQDPSITAVECDVMLGVALEGGKTFHDTPILAHPPNTESDISVASLLLRITQEGTNQEKILTKHLKLDFKDIKAVEPTLKLLQTSNISSPHEKSIFLNADILVGPGRRGDVPVPPDDFLQKCLEHIVSCRDRNVSYSLSLGYMCAWACNEHYNNDDVLRMEDYVRRYELTNHSEIGIVLALNARLLSMKPDAFDKFLVLFPQSKILAWTGTGEPSIPLEMVAKISEHFRCAGMKDRIDFDVTCRRCETGAH